MHIQMHTHTHTHLLLLCILAAIHINGHVLLDVVLVLDLVDHVHHTLVVQVEVEPSPLAS